jgi:hypothetical protein
MDAFASWEAALAGEKPPMHESEPWCGYFKMRDRRGLNKEKAAIKRPWIACAIWPGREGEYMAELAGSPISVDVIWPYCARYPISYETYAYWHQHDRWPTKETVS